MTDRKVYFPDISMKQAFATALLFAALSALAFAQPAKLQTTVPGGAATVTNWYKQSVYDPSNSKIGEIRDVLTTKRLFRLVFESHNGRALVPIPKRSTSP